MIEYYTLVDEDDVSSRIEVDLSLIEKAPDVQRPWLLWLFVKEPDGENESFVAFRDELAEVLEDQMEAVYAGTITKDGWSELYFYGETPKKFENLTSDVMAQHAGYPYERGSSKDTKWEMYLERLYPEPFALIGIQNRDTIAALVAAGDDLNIAREVEHYLFFQTPTALERFATSMISYGYSTKEYIGCTEDEYAYGVTLSKSQEVTPVHIEECTSLLFELVLQEHGRYEGWSTIMGKEESTDAT